MPLTPPSTPFAPSTSTPSTNLPPNPDATCPSPSPVPTAPTNPNIPIISTTFTGPPTLGPILETGMRRALLGWNHRKDTPEGLRVGRLWCWVGGSKRVGGGAGGLQVFDEPINRSPFPVGTGRGPNASGHVQIGCGVANFGMVRMFHPWWCPYSRVPKDMNSRDKKMCRHRYHQLIARKEEAARRYQARKNRIRSGNGNGSREGGQGQSLEEAIDVQTGTAGTGGIGNVRGSLSRNALVKRRREVLLREAMKRKRSGCAGEGMGLGKGTMEEPVVFESDDDTLVKGSASSERSLGRNGGLSMHNMEVAGGNTGDVVEMGGYRELRPGELKMNGTENDLEIGGEVESSLKGLFVS